MQKKLALFIFLFLNFVTAQAETTLSSIGQDFISPLQTPALWVTAGGSAATAAIWIDKRNTDEPVQEFMVGHKPLGKASRYGDLGGQMITNGAYVAGQLLAGAWGNTKGNDRALLMFKASAHSAIAATLLKCTVREERPNGSGQKTSFPSGHTTSAFAFASVVGTQHEWYWAAAAYSFAGFVAYSRLNDNAHWLHDVVAGATLGTAYGIGIAARSLGGSHAEADPKAIHWDFMPLPGAYAGVFQLQGRF